AMAARADATAATAWQASGRPGDRFTIASRAPVRGAPMRDCPMTIERRHVGKRLSGLVIHHASGTAYLAGQVADDPTADVSGQTRQVLKLIDSLLAEAGSDKTNILSATIFLPDIGDFAAMNAVWEEWVVAGQAP